MGKASPAPLPGAPKAGSTPSTCAASMQFVNRSHTIAMSIVAAALTAARSPSGV